MTATTWRTGTASDRGLERSTNEDRVYVDEARGIFLVVDGVGGQAAGEKAAEIAIEVIAKELARMPGPPGDSVRRSIVEANNEIYRLAESNPEWHGMACVLTLAVAWNDNITVGHVGDSRLYLAWDSKLRKLTPDHSPVGEREDMGELTEAQAMRHPGRNQVYREVGSALHEAYDEGFIEVLTFPFRNNAALLLCTDGLSDALTSAEISAIVETYDGDCEAVARELVAAANNAGGRDNVSVVFVAGPEFIGSASEAIRKTRARHAITRVQTRRWRRVIAPLLWVTGGVVLGFLAGRMRTPPVPVTLMASHGNSVVAGSDPRAISRALSGARPGDTVQVPPGEYLGPIALVDGVNLLASTPGTVVIRTDPGAGVDAGIAFVARGLRTGRLSGFRVVGEEQAPLATGVLIEDSGIEVDGLDISGAADAGIRIEGGSPAVIQANWLHSNQGSGILIGANSSPRVVGNRISNNGTAPGAPRPGIETHSPANPTIENNIITGNGAPNPQLSESNVTDREQ